MNSIEHIITILHDECIDYMNEVKFSEIKNLVTPMLVDLYNEGKIDGVVQCKRNMS